MSQNIIDLMKKRKNKVLSFMGGDSKYILFETKHSGVNLYVIDPASGLLLSEASHLNKVHLKKRSRLNKEGIQDIIDLLDNDILVEDTFYIHIATDKVIHAKETGHILDLNITALEINSGKDLEVIADRCVRP